MTTAHQRAAEYALLHRTGKCGEKRCTMVVEAEMALGLPKDPFKRQEFYEKRKELWNPLRTALDTHRWSFQVTLCDECGAEGLTLTGNGMSACVTHCLATPIKEWPMGWMMPWLYDLVDHSAKCTSHLSSLTPSSLDLLGIARTSSKTLRETMWPLNSTSSQPLKAATPKQNKGSSSGTHSPALASPRPKLRAFSIPKR